jgi:hypothetical protein
MGDPSAEAGPDRPMFVFTDETGAVVLMEDDLARMLGFDDAEHAVGDPLAAALGMLTSDAETLLKEISNEGRAKHRLARISNRRTGRAWWTFLSGSAQATGGRFIGADITVTPPTSSLPADDAGHRDTLERMAAMVRSRMKNGGGPVISEEKEIELRSYFAARMLAIYVLTVRMGGRLPGEALEQKVRRLNQERGWSIDMNRGRLTFGEAGLRPEACREITQVALSYAVQVTSKRLVARELSELDLNFSRYTVQWAAAYGLRGDL